MSALERKADIGDANLTVCELPLAHLRGPRSQAHFCAQSPHLILTRRNKSLARNHKSVRERLPICGLADNLVGFSGSRQFLSSKMNDLSVEVRHHDIIVSQPGTGLCMTYRRDPNSLMLEALCSMRSDPDAETLRFLTEAWKAAHAKAKALGWIR